MDPWFASLPAADLPLALATELDEQGFGVLPGLVPQERLERLVEAYDDAVAHAAPADTRTGRTSLRVTDFVNRGPAFDDLYIFPPLLAAGRCVIGQPFKLSAFHARTLLPGATGQGLHVDVPWQS